ncbi:uncharacterized protein LOC108923779 [Scleropages formosus]|uniref:Uncharacterized LOC108923779 n=1 Tax=Scleropages formosus TaxID=113540 RepID=A0A8C9SX96_SCLFO|nr:uncharacterized protein LOC108923779 [Scleropages formosus]XP_018590250.1 uncharacterized protein LOC108923779 [Scleropages formosus]
MRQALPILLPSVEPRALRAMVLLTGAARLTLTPLWVLLLLGELTSVCLICNGAVTSELSNSTDVHTHLSKIPAMSPTEVVPALEQSPEKVKAEEGEDVTFSCLVKGVFLTETAVQWHHHGPQGEQTVLKGNHTEGDGFVGRVFLSGNLGGGDVSMTLLNVSLEDRGVFLCLVGVHNGTVLQGSGTKLSILQRKGLLGLQESVGTIVGVAVAALGVAIGFVAIIVTQFREKLNCLQK